jgi:hypothetical protein
MDAHICEWDNDDAIISDPLCMRIMPLMVSLPMISICTHSVTREWVMDFYEICYENYAIGT